MTSSTAVGPDLALDPRGLPVIAWQQEVAGSWRVYLRVWDGQRWIELGGSATGGGLSGTTGHALRPRVAVDSMGRAVVAWNELETGSRTLQVYLRRWSGTAWDALGGSASVGGLSRTSDHAEAVTLALDATGNPVVAWEQTIPGSWPRYRQVYLRRWTGSAWEELGGSATGGGVSATPGQSQMPSVVVDSLGRPVVAWLEGDPRSREVRLARWDGRAWTGLGGSSGPGGLSLGPTGEDYRPALALDAADRPAVAWSNLDPTGAWQVYLRRFDGTAWVELAGSGSGPGLSATPGASRFADLAVDAATANPVVVWSDTSGPSSGWETYLRRWDGGAWVEVGGSATGGGLSAGTSGSSQIPSLAVDAQGRPLVAWEEGGALTQVYFRWWR
ncbi:MAG: hypothetical protein HY722_06320 [Planctomycetes bacterium]|nr:hypothetical protein [Planctomycetota bacterium]